MTRYFKYLIGTEETILFTESAQIDFVNLKNKAGGARRYGYTLSIIRYDNLVGEVVFAAEYQTTLNGSPYQASKRSAWKATEAEALAAGRKTVAVALKRYARLALDPANKIEKVA